MAHMKMIKVILTIVLMSWTIQAQAQGPGTCIQALIPCGPFLGSENPPATCCDPLKTAVETDLACLCAAFANPALAATYNMTQAMQLPLNCDIPNAGPSLCTNGGTSSPPTTSPGASAPLASTPSSTTPSTTTPSANAPSPSGNNAGRSIASAVPISSVIMLITGLMFS
ncbi:hypothetical protein RND81_13G046600 [Saponaria officinalis]|uniref:Bifunctional inhibitor/plant lipid transfer protein/seed storage helical domain-containing protein n=1 Tax=Saponaria officinalis TaxID=3572 RepID=A0AAW1GXJ7_SAPOF